MSSISPFSSAIANLVPSRQKCLLGGGWGAYNAVELVSSMRQRATL
jgi:hypothetical protein